MSEGTPCIIQAEYFFGDFRTYPRFLQNLESRIAEGVPFKRCIRFYDHTNRLSRELSVWGRRKRIKSHLVAHWTLANKRRQRLYSCLWSRLGKEEKRAQRFLPARIIDELRSCTVRHEPIALEEIGGNGFRLVERNELIELILVLERAEEHQRFFVFKHADLLADKVSLVGSVL